MTDRPDNAGVLVRPPIAWATAVAAGLGLTWLAPLPFLPRAWTTQTFVAGGMLMVLAMGLFAWAVATMTRGGSNVPTSRPTTTIVEAGPYAFSRNPIYLGMAVGLAALAIAFDSLWFALALAAFVLVIRAGVIAREEAYLERKFGDVYRRYRARVRRWL